jgi:hypothetical protein
MLRIDPKERITAKEALARPFFDGQQHNSSTNDDAYMYVLIYFIVTVIYASKSLIICATIRF